MRWNRWRYWRAVMWWVSWSFKHSKTITKIPLMAMPLLEFVYPAIPGNYKSNIKFERHVEMIFSPKAYREIIIGGKVYPLRLKKERA